VVTASSSRAFGATTVRSSRAFDGDRNTGWVPGRAIDGEWLSASFDKERTLSRVVIEQPDKATGWISAADIYVDGRRVATTTLTHGRVEVALPQTRATTVRLQVTAHEGEGFPIVSEIGLDGARVSSDSTAAAKRCVTIGTIDDDPVRVRLVGGVDGEGQRLMAGCEPLQLGPGEHRLRSLPGWTADSLVLRDSQGERTQAGAPGPDVTVDRKSSSSYRVEAGSADSPYLLVVGQNVNPGWRATMDGDPLGPPVVVDGYAMGWWVRDLGPHVFDVEYSPQGPSDIAMATSGGALILASGLLLVPGRGLGAPSSPNPAEHGVGGSRRRRRGLEWGGWFLFALGCGVFAGLPGLVAGVAVAVWSVFRAPAPRTLLRLSVVAMVLAPVAWVVGNLSRWGEVSPQLVLANPAPSVLVVLSLVLLVVGSWRDADPDDDPAPRDADPDLPAAGSAPG
jgi:arabinofuranan 3-O-arabinosyltransferase